MLNGPSHLRHISCIPRSIKKPVSLPLALQDLPSITLYGQSVATEFPLLRRVQEFIAGNRTLPSASPPPQHRMPPPPSTSLATGTTNWHRFPGGYSRSCAARPNAADAPVQCPRTARPQTRELDACASPTRRYSLACHMRCSATA
jgi:hypothetical protein